MARVKIYSTGTCPFCDKAKTLLKKWEIPFDEVRIDQDDAGLLEMQNVTNHARTVPQIVIDGKAIGGLDDLTELHMDGELDGLMEGEDSPFECSSATHDVEEHLAPSVFVQLSRNIGTRGLGVLARHVSLHLTFYPGLQLLGHVVGFRSDMRRTVFQAACRAICDIALDKQLCRQSARTTRVIAAECWNGSRR